MAERTRGETSVRSSSQQAARADSTASRSPVSSAMDASSGTQVSGFEDSVGALAKDLHRGFGLVEFFRRVAQARDSFLEELEALFEAHVLRLERANDLLEALNLLLEAHSPSPSLSF